jgi:hypothetical protein
MDSLAEADEAVELLARPFAVTVVGLGIEPVRIDAGRQHREAGHAVARIVAGIIQHAAQYPFACLRLAWLFLD